MSKPLVQRDEKGFAERSHWQKNIHVIAYARWQQLKNLVPQRENRNNKKLVHLFKSPPPFWLCSEFDPLLHCIFYWCHPCGGWLRRGEKIGRAFNRRSYTLGKQFRSRPYYEMRESVCIAMRRATFLHAACECRARFDRQPLRVRASSYLLATLFAINRETGRTCFVILFNQSGTAQITSCSAAAFNDRHSPLSLHWLMCLRSSHMRHWQ